MTQLQPPNRTDGCRGTLVLNMQPTILEIILGAIGMILAIWMFIEAKPFHGGEPISSVHAARNSVNAYQLDVGAYPLSLEGLVISESNAPGWQGPYMSAKLLPNRWGHRLIYDVSVSGYRISDLGKDERLGGVGANRDIVVDG